MIKPIMNINLSILFFLRISSSLSYSNREREDRRHPNPNTKIPSSLYPENHNETESRNEIF